MHPLTGVRSLAHCRLPFSHQPIGFSTLCGCEAEFEQLDPVRILFDNGAGGSSPGQPYPGFERSFSTFPVPGTTGRSWFFSAPDELSDVRPTGKAPARAKTPIVSTDGTSAGDVTSGGFSPTLNAPISIGYVATQFSEPGTQIELLVRGQPRAAEVVALPFTPHNYVRKGTK